MKFAPPGVLAWAGVGLAAMAAGPPLGAGAAPPASASPGWVAYAATLGERMRERLARENDPVSVRLHGVLDDQAAGAAARAAPRIVVRVWLDAQGRVARVAFASLGDPGADDDLRSLLDGIAVGRAPPADMPQPISLALQVTPATGD